PPHYRPPLFCPPSFLSASVPSASLRRPLRSAHIVCRRTGIPGVLFEEAASLFQVSRMEVTRSKPLAARERDLGKLGSRPRDCGIVQAQPAGSFQQAQLGKPEEASRRQKRT